MMTSWTILCLQGLAFAFVVLWRLPRLNLIGRIGTTFCGWYVGYILTCVSLDVYTGDVFARYSSIHQYLPVILIHGCGYFWPASIPGLTFSAFGTVWFNSKRSPEP